MTAAMTDQLKQLSEAATPERLFRRIEWDKMTKRARVLFCRASKPGTDETAYIRADVAEAQLTEARDEALTWRKVAQSATPGGSEYMDPEYTREHISEQRERFHNAMKTRVLTERELTEARAQVAVAYEVAATSSVMSDFNYDDERRAWSYAQHKIRSLTPSDTTTALEQIKQEARDEGKRECVDLLQRTQEELRLIRMKDTGAVYDVLLRAELNATLSEPETSP
jgi:hypothetical protein